MCEPLITLEKSDYVDDTNINDAFQQLIKEYPNKIVEVEEIKNRRNLLSKQIKKTQIPFFHIPRFRFLAFEDGIAD